MPVVNSLALDHFYISLPEDRFDQYKEFFCLLGGSHQSILTTDDSWEGLYSYSRIRDYFEILKGKRTGGLGLAMSPVGLINVNVNNITEELNQLKWKRGTRYFSNNEPWFNWYSLGNYIEADHTFFNVWIMDYYKSHIDYITKPLGKVIDSFLSLEVSLGIAHLDEIQNSLLFSNYIKNIKDDVIEIAVPRRDGWDFNIKINLISGNSKITPTKIDLAVYALPKSVVSKIHQYKFASLNDNILTVHF